MKNVFLSILLFFVSVSVFAQYEADSIVSTPKIFELSINGNRSCISSDEKKNKLGFGVSMQRIWRSEKTISIVAGVWYNRTCYYQDHQQASKVYYEDIYFHLTNLSFPLMFRANLGAKYRFFVESGISFDFMPFLSGTGSKTEWTLNGGSTKKNFYEGFELDKHTDCGFNLGLGLKIPYKKRHIILEGMYHCPSDGIFKKSENINQYFALKVGIELFFTPPKLKKS